MFFRIHFYVNFSKKIRFSDLPSLIMKIICAGLPRTGTKTIAAALRHLDYTVHDVKEQLDVSIELNTPS